MFSLPRSQTVWQLSFRNAWNIVLPVVRALYKRQIGLPGPRCLSPSHRNSTTLSNKSSFHQELPVCRQDGTTVLHLILFGSSSPTRECRHGGWREGTGNLPEPHREQCATGIGQTMDSSQCAHSLYPSSPHPFSRLTFNSEKGLILTCS